MSVRDGAWMHGVALKSVHPQTEAGEYWACVHFSAQAFYETLSGRKSAR